MTIAAVSSTRIARITFVDCMVIVKVRNQEKRIKKSSADCIHLAPSCTDKIKNGGEVGVDCGGPCRVKCDNQTCAAGQDCKSGVCARTKRCAGTRHWCFSE